MKNTFEKTDEKKESNWQSFWELARFVIIAILIVVPIRIFIAQPFIVSGSSMFPTFKDRQYLIVDELSYDFKAPQRDDVIVFRNPKDTKIFFIKRIIGLPGETVDVKNNETFITNKEHPEGFKVDESFIQNVGGPDAHMELGPDEYFVMGDNRPNSSDSRYWGVVPKKDIIGRVFLRLLPINTIGVFPGKHTQN